MKFLDQAKIYVRSSDGGTGRCGFHVVGPVGSLDESVDIANEIDLDGALLDINIIGGRVDHVADIMDGRRVPFNFVSVYGRDNLPKNFVDATLVNKPFNDAALIKEVRRIGQGA